MVVFNDNTIAYNAVERVLVNKQGGKAYSTSISEVFGDVTKIQPFF